MQTIHALSVGNVAVNLQTSVAIVLRIADRLKLEPVLLLDNVKHFDETQVERIRKEIQSGARK